MRIREAMVEAAADWKRLNRDRRALSRGAKLLHAEEWAEDHWEDMNAAEQEFVQASVAARESQLREAKLVARRNRRLAWIGGIASHGLDHSCHVAFLQWGVASNRARLVAAIGLTDSDPTSAALVFSELNVERLGLAAVAGMQPVAKLERARPMVG